LSTPIASDAFPSGARRPDHRARAASFHGEDQALGRIGEKHSRIKWIERECGWVAAPEDIVNLLSNEGFAECKRETTTSGVIATRRAGTWQGVDPRTGRKGAFRAVPRPSAHRR
jgi:hypothetical protein